MNPTLNYNVSQSRFSVLLPAREVNVFTGVCHSVYNRPYGYSVTAHGRYTFYWNTVLLELMNLSNWKKFDKKIPIHTE